jgi:hypothetical protein
MFKKMLDGNIAGIPVILIFLAIITAIIVDLTLLFFGGIYLNSNFNKLRKDINNVKIQQVIVKPSVEAPTVTPIVTPSPAVKQQGIKASSRSANFK